jgi:type I site-specific restriction endonuclease
MMPPGVIVLLRNFEELLHEVSVLRRRKNDSNWRQVLDYFSEAIQVGLTATPKETRYVSNIDYFGKPIYEYSLKQGIEDIW